MQNLKPQPERVWRIKKERERQDKTVQQIIDDGIAMKVYTAQTTLYRIFAPGSEEVGFRDSTLSAVEKILGISNEEETKQTPDTVADTGNQELLERIIKEMNQQLKASRRAHAWKNAAIAFLTVLLAALLAVDRVLPEVGWYGTTGTAAWWCIAGLLAAFVVAVAAYHAYLHVHVRTQEKADHDIEQEM